MAPTATPTADYARRGYCVLPGLVPPEVTRSFLHLLQDTIAHAARSPVIQPGPAMTKQVIEIYGYHYKPLLAFLWGLTPTIRDATGLDLLPSYSYLRIYQQGDILRVHSDRPACEHSLSLTMDYSEGVVWPLEIGEQRLDHVQPLAPDFGDAPFASLAMNPGDALLYKGFHHAHGRTSPNPNRWSAHMFLHWVERGGRHADQAFDGRRLPPSPDFQFP
jgi:hypothetical protein